LFVLQNTPKFAVPLPKGGRNEPKLIFTEDQLTGVRTKRDKEIDVLSDDWSFQKLKQPEKQPVIIVGYGKNKNPNIPKKSSGKKKNRPGFF
jgi:hypothetical protein